MKINVHAGHNPDGKKGCGAIGLIKESTEARNVKNEVIRLLQLLGHTVYDCTVDDGTSASNVLTKIVQKCNAHTVDLDVSIHFNSGANDKNGNGTSTGTEVYVYSKTGNQFACNVAERVVNSLATLGFKKRGVKANASLYVLRKTKAPAILIEVCFVDDKDDVQLYNAFAVAREIVHGITGEYYEEPKGGIDSEAQSSNAETATGSPSSIYRVQVGAFSDKANAVKLQKELQSKGYNAIITQ